MSLHLDDFIRIIAEICEEKKLKVAFSEALKGGLITGLAAVLGGLALGPIGLALGGAVGGGVSAINARKKFKPAAVIIREMTQLQKQKLYEKILYAFRDFGAKDVMTMLMMVKSQMALQEIALGVVKKYLNEELSLQVIG